MQHFRIVERSLNGKRSVDEQTLASLAVLSERLEGLRKVDERYREVKFSSDVKSLRAKKKEPAVC
jgi:hypothetical protein